MTGQPLFTISDPNCHCFNPQTTQVLNPAAWTDAPGGTWSTSAPFYNNYRWQRQPAESMSFGRNFRMGKEGKYNLQVRAEFQNIFNRLFLSPPAVANTNPALPIATTNSGGNAVNSSGFGSIATVGGVGDTQRSGSESAAQRSDRRPVYLLMRADPAGALFLAGRIGYVAGTTAAMRYACLLILTMTGLSGSTGRSGAV